MHSLSILLGIVIAWLIITFIGPRPIVSYYVQAPIRLETVSELDNIMEAVGLKPSVKSVADMTEIPEVPEVMAPEPQSSVADLATQVPADATQQFGAPDDQDTQTILQPSEPVYEMAPLIQ